MEITSVISSLRESIATHKYIIIPTRKNRDSRRKYGLTILELEDFLISITDDDLFSGPVEDRDYPGEELFIFKRCIIRDIVFYVKVKCIDGMVKILSCHEDEVRF